MTAASEAVAEEIRSAGGAASAFEADCADPASIDALVAEVGDVEVLVNNAARVWAAPTLDYPLDGWDKVFALNVRGLFYLSQQVAKGMLAAAGGRTWQERIERTLPAWKGAFSLVVLASDQVIAVRDAWGFRPLSVGRLPHGGHAV